MALQKYAVWARARADEIRSLLDEDEIAGLREWLRTNADDELLRFIFTLSPRVEVILEFTEAKDRAWITKTPRPVFLRDWLAARYWALLSANALSLAADLERIPGLRYREAVRETAPVAGRWMDPPELEDLLTRRLYDE